MEFRPVFVLMIVVLGMFNSLALAVYDPSVGRFIQRDPAGYHDGGNLYNYALSNPITALDPYGLFIVEFDPGVSKDERKKINKALKDACNAAEEANKELDNVSQCAVDKLGEEFQEARNKLKQIERGCNSTSSLKIGNKPGGEGAIGEFDIDLIYPGEPWLPLHGPPEIIFMIDVILTEDELPTPAELILHELTHYAENFSKDDLDRDGTGRLDDGYGLEDIAGPDGFSGSPLGEAVAEAEKCCGN